MTKTFKITQEQSTKKIHELQIKYEMCMDDRKADKIAFDKRLNMLIRDFVTVYKKLVAEYIQYKDYTNLEMDIFKQMIKKKDAMIKDLTDKVDNYKLALRIPRAHFKEIEKLQYEELMEQRDAIIKKFKKKGIDITKKGALANMPGMP